ncbi:hypothetical protein, partial [Bacillus cereus]|uniref:hypothetical protein n=1 Tax=Bacillus cereus TaxID=1396 RepID=UPI0018DEEE4E
AQAEINIANVAISESLNQRLVLMVIFILLTDRRKGVLFSRLLAWQVFQLNGDVMNVEFFS